MRKTKLALILAVSSLSLVSCGNVPTINRTTIETNPSTNGWFDPSSPTNPSSNLDTSIDGPAPKPEEIINIDFWHIFGTSIQPTINKFADDFEDLVYQNEGVKVNVNAIPQNGSYSDLNGMVLNSFNNNTQPNLVYGYPKHILSYIEKNDDTNSYILDISDYITNSTYGLGKDAYLSDTLGTEDIIPAFLSEGSMYSKQGTYSFPFAKTATVMFYNQDLMQTAFSLYKTEHATSITDYKVFLDTMNWDEFIDLCEIIYDNKSTFTGSSTDDFYPFSIDYLNDFFVTKLIQSGEKYLSINNNGKGEVNFNTEGTISLLKELKEDRDDIKFTAMSLNSGIFSSSLFVNKKALFAIGPSGGAEYYEPTSDKFNVGITKVPPRCDKNKVSEALYDYQGTELAILNNPSLSKTEQEKEALYTWKFIKYITNTENNAKFSITSNSIPIRKSVASNQDYINYLDKNDLYSKANGVIINTMKNQFFTTPVFKGIDVISDQLDLLVYSVLSGGKTTEKALEDALTEINKAL